MVVGDLPCAPTATLDFATGGVGPQIARSDVSAQDSVGANGAANNLRVSHNAALWLAFEREF
jgi:hypothetical protein